MMMCLLLLAIAVISINAASTTKTPCSRQSDCVPAFGSQSASVCVHRNDDGATTETQLSLEYWVCSLVNVTKITEDDAVARCGSPKNVSTLPVGVNSVKVSDNVVNVVGQVLLPSAVVKVGAINLSWDQTVRECCSKDDRVCDPSIVKLNRVSKTFTYQAAVLGQDCSHSTSEKPVTMVLMYRTAEKTSTAAAPTTAASSAASTVAVPNDCICDRCCPPAAQCKTGCRNPKEPDLCSMFQSSSAAIASLGGWLTTLTLLASVQL